MLGSQRAPSNYSLDHHSVPRDNSKVPFLTKTVWYYGTREIVARKRPEAYCHCPFDKGAAWKQFLHSIKARNLSWAGVEQGRRPEWSQSLLEPVSRKLRMASPTTARLYCKSAATLSLEKPASLQCWRRYMGFDLIMAYWQAIIWNNAMLTEHK